jgi:uncharacterized protein DUF3592
MPKRKRKPESELQGRLIAGGLIMPFLLVVLGLLGWHLYGIARDCAPLTWEKTEGTIVHADLEERTERVWHQVTDHIRRDFKTYYIPHVTYRYEVDGRAYMGSTLRGSARELRFHGPRSPEKRLENEWAAGATVTVYHHPDAPNRSALHATPFAVNLLDLWKPILIVVIVCIPLRHMLRPVPKLWRERKRDAESTEDQV